MTDGPPTALTARTDHRDWLLTAEEPLAGLQLRAGGELPGIIAAPALLELVRKSRSYGLRLARAIEARDGDEQISAWAEVEPDADGGGCNIRLSAWRSTPLPLDAEVEDEAHRAAIARDAAELTARLGPRQEVLAATGHAPDMADLAARMGRGAGRHWAEFVAPAEEGGQVLASLPWGALDGVRLRVAGSDRRWTAHLHPLGPDPREPTGFDLTLVADQPMAPPVPHDPIDRAESGPARMGRELAPVLRQPVARIIANAETIRTQLAGPLAQEYANYAADIASAGEHLLALIADLADLEAVEDANFSTVPDRIELADIARRAAGILAVRAQQKDIVVETPRPEEQAPAIGEFRRVLQIVLNLLGNAIRYSPPGAHIALRIGGEGDTARLTVADQGEGIAEDEQQRIFEKFERLGRSGDGGTGLGLYISRRLARAMDGELSVESRPGEGARFTLRLPADPAG